MVVAAAVLAFDIATPLGVASGVPYLALVLLGAWFPRRRDVFVLAGVGSALTVVGYFLSPEGGVAWVVLTNRGLALFAIWVTAILLAYRKRLEERLAKARDELEDRVAERTSVLRREISEREQAQQSLLASRWALRELTLNLSAVEERERRRFAIYLHDQIGQPLALLRVKCGILAEASEADALKQSIAEIRDLLAQVIKDTQTLTFDLSSPALYELGLGPAIRQIGEQISVDHGLRFDFEDDEECKLLDPDLAIKLYRSTRELLTNIVKHAQARAVSAALRRTDGEVHVVIEDDGVGFDLEEIETHAEAKTFGLFSIREQLHLIGGRLEVESRPAKGTRATLVVPIAAAKEPRTGSTT